MSAGSSARLNIAAFAGGFATFINMWCTQALLPVLAASFHVSEARTGLTVTAPLVATAMAAPVVGLISDRFGRKKFILGAVILLLVPTILAATARSFEALVVWRFVQGLLLPFIFTITIAYIGEETSGAAAARLAGTYMSGAIFGGFCGRLLAGMMTSGFGWRAAFWAIAAMTLLLAAIIAVMLPREKLFQPMYGVRRALGAFPLHLSNVELVATCVVGFGVLFNLVAVFTYINFRLAAAPYFLGPAALGGIFVVYLGGVVMSPLSARLANHFGRRRVMAVAAPLVWVGLALTLAAPLWLIGLGLLLMSSAIFMQQTLATAYVSVAAREAKSTAVGLYVAIYYVGGSAGGVVPGRVWHGYGWPGCVAIVCAMQVMMLVVALRFWRAA
ncbi:MFS transporter [Acidocella aquatica]|uniref:MFS transporter n=1 Tax=Acidocella aquatica TaxID=1922313 RepID=UPI0024E106E2|nr:MFS transporter [Acidocella aquatica]